MKLPFIYRSPDAAGSGATATTGTSTAPKAPPKTNATAPKNGDRPVAKGQAKGTAASDGVGHREGDGAEGNNTVHETAADRARARKAAADDRADPRSVDGFKSKLPKSTSKKGIQSLADLRKLHSDNVPEGKQKKAAVEVDNEALPNPKPAELERGRAEPKVSRKQAAENEGEVEGTEVAEPIEEAVDEIEASEVDTTEEIESEESSQETETDFEPRTKFKAYGEEHDIPEMFHSLMVDPESERQVHELFEKSTAFERTKQRLVETETAIQEQIMPKLHWYDNVRSELNELAQARDVFGLLEKFGFDEKSVLRAAADHVTLMEADPQVRAEYERRKQLEKQNRELAKRTTALEQQSSESAKLAKQVAFESLLARDDIKSLADDFDSKWGIPGYFKKQVALHAHNIYLQSLEAAKKGSGRVVDLAPEEAIQDFMRVHGLNFPEAGQAPAPKAPARQAANGQTNKAPQPKASGGQPAQKPKVIPNLGSRSATTTDSRPQFKSAREIAEFRKQKYGR